MKRNFLFRISLIIFIGVFFSILGVASFSEQSAYAESEKVYLGAIPLGIAVRTDGVFVGDFVDVVTDKGSISPARDIGIQKGDQIVSINGKMVNSAAEIAEIVGKYNGKPMDIQFKRNGEILSAKIIPAKDGTLKQYKLGFMTKRDVAGIGTLTYVKPGSLRYGSLGHRIYDIREPDTDYKCGHIFSASIQGYVRGERNKVGELKGIFTNRKPKGSVDKNTPFGIFGYMDKDAVKGLTLVEVGSRSQIKMDKAYICTTINGEKPEQYSIEIVRLATQNSPAEKGMVIRVTDERLLKCTGGIVQGMSGSPILQNGKLIGAVSHVFTNDPTMGYAMYIDWMINN